MNTSLADGGADMGMELDELVAELLAEKRALETNENDLRKEGVVHAFGRFKRRGAGEYVHFQGVGTVLMPMVRGGAADIEARLKKIAAELLELQEARIAERDRRITELEKKLEAAMQNAPVQNAPVQNAPVQNAPVQNAPVQNAPVQNAPAQDATEQKADDLKRIEGIGPKIAELLMDGGIRTFRELATTEPSRIKELLTKGGNRFATAEPASWPMQAKLAAEARWAELDELQAKLDGGRFSD